MVGTQVVVRARLFDSAGLVLAGAVDYDIAPHDYLSYVGRDATAVLTPWRLRPALFLGLCFRVTGPSGCAGPM
jgi:hypothetical protein